MTSDRPGMTPLLQLPRVRAEQSRLLRTTVGLRPYRPDGFVVRAERIGEKLVVHDYGHGGSGMTLCWGTAQMAVELALYNLGAAAGVIGCGVIGLATARLLQRRGVKVTIYTVDEPPHTTSDVSGAFWAPFGLVDDGRLTPDIAGRVVKAARIAHEEFERLRPDPRYAIRRLPIYYIADTEPSPGIEKELLPDLFDGPILRPGAHPWGMREVMVVEGMCFDPTPFLEAVHEDFLREGGSIVHRKVASREDIASLPEPVVFNCTGLGSRELASDAELIPMKGQLNLFQAQPEIDYMIALERERIYMMPRRDCIVVGTSKVRNDWTLTPDPNETARVVGGIRRLYED
ncbi:MAG TPA: FAD-dependent oxidoreductase [Gemmatimonadaceae bacterium]|nr:FAD-dependent oxidoreductase [Gemmatimonadaceae bacterium]